MPWYRIDDGKGGWTVVHVRGTSMPGACVARDVELGERCLRMGEYLCDGQIGGGRTCDDALCENHATEIGPDRHLCPACLEAKAIIERMQRCNQTNN